MANPTLIFNTKLNQSGALRDAKTLRDSLGRPIDIKLNTRSLAQPLGRITGDVAEFTKSLQAATARVTAFGATSGGIIAVSQAISEVAKSVIEVDKQLTELNTFLGQSQGKLQSVGDSLFKIAKNTASSFSDTAEAAKEFARQGLSVEETLKRTNDALVLSRISGLGAAESVNALTTAINSFNKSGLDSAEIVNKLVKVDSNFAVSAADLAQALTRVGSAAQDSGVGFEELIAVVTTAQQTTGRGGAIIGNALKTIFTRLKRPEVLDQLQQLGVAVKDQNGALLSGTSILKNYIDATKNLGQVERARNDELLGGVYQINQLKAITTDLAKANGIYYRSLQIANSATDDAIKKNEELNKSLSAIIQNTRTNFQQRGGSIGEPLFRPIVKKGADIANFLLNNVGVSKEGADKEGKDLGSSFAQSFLKGVGEAIAGPGLVLIGALTINIGKRLLSFVTDASKVLLNINSAAANTQAIEQAINNTLAQQPKLTQAIAQGQITREQAAAQLLKLFTQQNQQLVLQKGLASSLAQSFAKSGFVASPEYGIYRNVKRKAEGYIPSFAAEKREAMSYGANPSVQPYMTRATIKGVPQNVIVNTGETIIPNYAGGTDTAIIPNYAKGNIPTSRKTFKINSPMGMENLIRNNKQKYLSIRYKTEEGVIKDFEAQDYVAQFGPSVRVDEYVGQSPPKGYKSWKEFREATNTISIRTAKGQRKTFRGDRILQVNARNNSFVPSDALQKANELTAPFTSAQLRAFGIDNNTKLTSVFASGSYKDIKKAMANQRSSINKSTRNLARGYVPSPRISGKVGTPIAAPTGQNKTSFDNVIGSAVTSAIYFALPSVLGGFANEQNQELVGGGLKTAAAINLLTSTISGFKKGGAKGALISGIGASITSGSLLSQASQVKESVKAQTFDKARDKAQDSFNKLTSNINDLVQTISDLDSLYSDPNARPEALIKLSKKEQDLLNKIALTNPTAAIAYKAAATPEEKQKALTSATEVAQKEASVSKSVIDFASLNQSQRDAKTVINFFKDLAGQLDTTQIDVKNLNTGNLPDLLRKGGIGGAQSLFAEGKSGQQLSQGFIEFLKTQDKIVELTKKTEEDIGKIRGPINELITSNEAKQALRTASTQARSGYLENISKMTGGFGERAGIESKAQIEQYTLGKPEREAFSNRIRAESKNLNSSYLKFIVGSFPSQGPGKNVASTLQKLMTGPYGQKDLEVLQRILAQNTTSSRKLENIEKITNVQKEYALKALSFQEKLSFGGGIKTAIDASSRIESFKNTQKGALQYQLGSLFGSKETQIAGLTNFATNLKEKYAGVFEKDFGKQVFGQIADQLTNLKVADIRQSLGRDIMTARGIGQFGLASQLQSQLLPENQGSIYEAARLQAEQQLGLAPEKTIKDITKQDRAEEVKSAKSKFAEDAAIKAAEDSLKPALNAISSSFVKQLNELQEPLKASLQNAFAKGVEISNASLVIQSLDALNFGGAKKETPKVTSERSAPFAEGEVEARKKELGLAKGFIPNFSNGALSDAVSREMGAGYSASQIKIGQSSSLKTSFNPQGLGVFNSTEGSLGNGMSLARSAGLNPKTKGMADGFIPNFADGQQELNGWAKRFQDYLLSKMYTQATADKKSKLSKTEILDIANKIYSGPGGSSMQKLADSEKNQAIKNLQEQFKDNLILDNPFENTVEIKKSTEQSPASTEVKKIIAEVTKKIEAPKPAAEAANIIEAAKSTPQEKKQNRLISKPKTKSPKSIIQSQIQTEPEFGSSIFDPGASNFERLASITAKFSAERLAKEQSIESIKQRSVLQSRAARQGVPLKDYAKFWQQNTTDLRIFRMKQEVEGQGLLPLQMTGRTKEGQWQKSVKTFVEDSIARQREAEKTQKEIEALKAETSQKGKSGKGQLPLFEQERAGGSAFGKGTGTYAPAKGLTYLSVYQAEQNRLQEEAKLQLEAQARSEKLLSDYQKRTSVPSEDILSARRQSIFGQTPEEKSRMEQGLFEQQYRELQKQDAEAKIKFESDYKKLEQQEAAAKKKQAKAEAAKKGNLPPKPIKFITPASGLENLTSPLFKQAGPGLLFTGSFGESPQITGDLPISTYQGFKATKDALLSNPEIAKAIIGDNYSDVLKNTRTFNKWNKSQGEAILGINNKGGSLVARLPITTQQKISQIIAASATIAGGGAGAGGGGGFGGSTAGGAAGGAGFGGGASGTGGLGGVGGGAGAAGGGMGGGTGGAAGPTTGAGVGSSAASKGSKIDFLKYRDIFYSKLGYIPSSKIDINRAAKQLLALDKSLSENNNLSEKTKATITNDFLEKQGGFASKVQERANDIAARRRFAGDRFDLLSKYSSLVNKNTGKIKLNNTNVRVDDFRLFDSISKDLYQAVSEGKITPQQAAKLQSEIYTKSLGATSDEYAQLLKNRKLNPSLLSDYYAQEREPSFQEQLKAKATADDLANVQKKLKKVGLAEFINPNNNRVELRATDGTQGGLRWRSFSDQRIAEIKQINTNPNLTNTQKEEAKQKILKDLTEQERKAKTNFAKNRGFEYNPLTGEVEVLGSQKQRANAAKAAAEEITEAQAPASKFSKGLGIAGAFYGLYSSYESLTSENADTGEKIAGALYGAGAIASLPVKKMVGKVEGKFGEGALGKFAGGIFGLGGAISYGAEAIKQAEEGEKGKAIYSSLEALISGGAGVASLAGQHLLSQRLFAAGAGLSLVKQIYQAENAQIASGSTTVGRIASLLTGQNFENFGELDDKQKRAVVESAIGDFISTAFTATMGPVGMGVASFKVGYRAGNLIEEGLGIGEKLGDIMSGGTRGIFDPYKGVKFNERQNYTRKDFETDADYKKFLQEELKRGLSLAQYKDYNLRLSDIYASGFIPNFAALEELSAIKNNPAYAGYRNAVPVKSSIYDDKIINTAEIETPVQDVYARMFGPIGYSMKPKNPNETHAILNPAQQKSLGYAGGFVPNFSMEEFASTITEAMKNGMTSYAGGIVPQSSNNVYLNDNRSYSEASNEMMQGVLDILFDKYPQEMAALGPKITKFR